MKKSRNILLFALIVIIFGLVTIFSIQYLPRFITKNDDSTTKPLTKKTSIENNSESSTPIGYELDVTLTENGYEPISELEFNSHYLYISYFILLENNTLKIYNTTMDAINRTHVGTLEKVNGVWCGELFTCEELPSDSNMDLWKQYVYVKIDNKKISIEKLNLTATNYETTIFYFDNTFKIELKFSDNTIFTYDNYSYDCNITPIYDLSDYEKQKTRLEESLTDVLNLENEYNTDKANKKLALDLVYKEDGEYLSNFLNENPHSFIDEGVKWSVPQGSSMKNLNLSDDTYVLSVKTANEDSVNYHYLVDINSKTVYRCPSNGFRNIKLIKNNKIVETYNFDY